MKAQRRSLLRLWIFFVLLLSLVAIPYKGSAAFPGENGKIAFSSNEENARGIYVMNPDGSGRSALTDNWDLDPAWSPDGSRIAFVRNVGDLQTINYEIFVMNADGSGQTRLTDDPGDDLHPTWSPDSKKIAFDSNRLGWPNYEIFVMNADGSGLTNLTNYPYGDSFPAWSPDGAKIAFHSWRDFRDVLYVMNADGSNQTALTFGPEMDFSPNWSPDGMKIVFSRYHGGRPQIYTMDADGSNQVRLTDGPTDDAHPAWSPDGEKIVYARLQDGGDNFEIYVMDADGSNQTRLTDNSAGDSFPDWQPLNANTVPVCTKAVASQAILWPANHKFVPIQVLGVNDPDGDAVSLVIDRIFQDEAVDAPGSGGTSPDAKGVGAATAAVRAERMGSGDGRVYHIGFTAADADGAVCRGEVTVGVPKSRGQWQPVDGGALYDATAVAGGTNNVSGAFADGESDYYELLLPFVKR
jgi:dipeptidyl aminopeptidase/acylaminoacyl peptidase